MTFCKTNLTLLYLLICVMLRATSIDITGQLILPESESKPHPPTTRIALDGGETFSYSQKNGEFSFYNVLPGIHTIDVQSPIYHFSQIKLNVPEVAQTTEFIQVLEYIYPGAPKTEGTYPLTLVAHTNWSYFEPRGKFSIFTTLKRNPMIVMIVVIIGFMSLAPKLMENMDPEALQTAREEQQKIFSSIAGKPKAEQPSERISNKKKSR
mmetsp:Transcript_4090/g.6243  ORF Transcript_4090/g.6243 Transcript_4090/m.6243 type:complete len:209 (-) Transcript_4090:36-662(-)